jgi:hypothetical protein
MAKGANNLTKNLKNTTNDPRAKRTSVGCSPNSRPSNEEAGRSIEDKVDEME